MHQPRAKSREVSYLNTHYSILNTSFTTQYFFLTNARIVIATKVTDKITAQ